MYTIYNERPIQFKMIFLGTFHFTERKYKNVNKIMQAHFSHCQPI